MYCRVVIPTVLLFGSLVQAQDPLQQWIMPAAPAFTTNFTLGETYQIQWTADLAASLRQQQSTNASKADLWITDDDLHLYSHRIAVQQDLRTITSLSWRADVPPDEVLATDRWVFRWLPVGATDSDTATLASSPGFFIHNETSDTTSSATATAGSSAPGTTPPSEQGCTDVDTSPSCPAHCSSSTPMSTNAKVGISLAAVVAAAAFFGFGWFGARKYGGPRCDRPAEAPPKYVAAYVETKDDGYPQQQHYTGILPPQPRQPEP